MTEKQEIKTVDYNSNSNLERIKPVYFIDTKIKNKNKTYVAIMVDITTGYVKFKGAEIEDPDSIRSFENAVSLISQSSVEKYTSWNNGIDITVKRFMK